MRHEKEANLENTNNNKTLLQNLFVNNFFKIYFFVFLFLFFIDNYQIIFSSIKGIFLNFNFTDYLITFKEQKLIFSSLLSISFFFDITEPILLLVNEKMINPNNELVIQAFGVAAFVFPMIFVIVSALIISSTIIAFRDTKNFILNKTKFSLFFYILFFICIYSIYLIITANAILTPFGHMFMTEKLNIKNIQISTMSALFTTIAFKILINFTLKDKK